MPWREDSRPDRTPDHHSGYDTNCNFSGKHEGLWARWGQYDDAIDHAKVCIDGKPYWIMGVEEPQNGQYQAMGMGNCSTPGPSFKVLPGIKDLDGKNWGGLTKEGIVRGALNSYDTNGGKDG